MWACRLFGHSLYLIQGVKYRTRRPNDPEWYTYMEEWWGTERCQSCDYQKEIFHEYFPRNPKQV